MHHPKRKSQGWTLGACEPLCPSNKPWADAPSPVTLLIPLKRPGIYNEFMTRGLYYM